MNQAGPQGAIPTDTDRIIIARDNITFRLRSAGNHLVGCFEAPTRGWLAAGFNNHRGLASTRFLIAARDGETVTYEEHIAQPPDHKIVQSLGGTPSFSDVSARFEKGRTRVEFTLQRMTPAPFLLDLSLGTEAQLMLAWSREVDFDHHSAWRQHFPIIL